MDLEAALEGYTRRDWQTTDEGTVRFALVGLGWWTVDEAMPAIADSDLCETTVLVSSSAEKARRVADEAGAAAAAVEHAVSYDEFHDGAAADAYDAVYICTPNALHLEYVETATDLGKAVLCEKPMEATVERAERMHAACEEAGVQLMVAYRLHTLPAARRARDLVRAGVIGEPVQVHGANSQRLLGIIDDPDQWRLDPDLTGYGTSVMDLGIYPINTTRFVLERDPVEAVALAGSYGDAFADVPDERSAFALRYEGGVHAAMSASQHAHGETRLAVTGTEGQVELSPAFHMDARLSVSRDGATVAVDVDDVDEMREEFDYFADRVLTGGDIHADGEHGLVDMKALRAIYESAETGEAVAIGSR